VSLYEYANNSIGNPDGDGHTARCWFYDYGVQHGMYSLLQSKLFTQDRLLFITLFADLESFAFSKFIYHRIEVTYQSVSNDL
jgi:hypothetical protein